MGQIWGEKIERRLDRAHVMLYGELKGILCDGFDEEVERRT